MTRADGDPVSRVGADLRVCFATTADTEVCTYRIEEISVASEITLYASASSRALASSSMPSVVSGSMLAMTWSTPASR